LDRLEYLYREYVRLGDAIDSLARSSFDDFKLLGAIGALLAWPPLATSDLFDESGSGNVLFVGLVAILFIVTIIAVRDLLKQSVIRFYQELGQLEVEIRKELHLGEDAAFRYASAWPEWERRRQRPIILRFQLLFIAVLVPFPTLVLALESDRWQALTYFVIALFVLAVFADAVTAYLGRPLTGRAAALIGLSQRAAR